MNRRTKPAIRHLIILVFIMHIFLLSGFSQNNSENFDKEIDDILEQMTLEEKAGQMTQVTLEVILKSDEDGIITPQQIDSEKLKKAVVDYGVGSILNNGGHAYSRQKWLKIISTIQDVAMNETRLNIPVIYGIDAIHGMNYTTEATLFPQQLALAATWNPDLVEESASITAYETRASSIHWNFSPVLGIGRNPLWPRLWETFGEDVHLTEIMGEAMIKGYEGEDISNKEKVASCIKHFAGYSMPLSGKDRTPAWIPERMFREYFLPPFQKAVDAGSLTAMINSGEVNGIPAHTSKFLLTDILKDEMDFKGFAVSDWEDIKYLHDRHKVAASQKEAVKMAIDAGLDMSMVPSDFSFAEHLIDLVKEGKINEKRLDESVRRILRVKYTLGLFETPVTFPEDYPEFGSEEFRNVSQKAAEESITLLKNDNNTLPLPENANVLITGPTANSMVPLNGGWSYTWQGEQTDKYAAGKNTILESFRQKLGKESVTYSPGASFDSLKNPEKVKELASETDYVVLCLGESSYTEKPGDINNLDLSRAQLELAKIVSSAGKPVILVLTEGRPRIIREIEDMTDAVVMAYLPGNEGGPAITNVITGVVNPSGKLPLTYPRYNNDLITYDHKHTAAIDAINGENAYNPQYPFGHGLSYTSFEYSDLVVSKPSFNKNEDIHIEVKVKNTGERAGKETVQLYVSDQYATITPSVKRLRGFEKISLKPGDIKTVKFSLKPSDLAFVGRNNKWVVEPGMFTVKVDSLEKEFELTK